MPKKIIKKTKRQARPIKKNIAAEPLATPEYISINEHQAELDAKNKKLWLIVGIFAILLVCGWLIILRAGLRTATDQAGFSQISQEISDTLAKFDTEIKNRAKPQPINVDDLTAIKDNLEQQIKSNPDSSSWPTHELDKIALTVQYPDDWKNTAETKTAITLTDSATFTAAKYGRITINARSNAKKYNLTTWLTKNKIDLTGYIAEKPLFVSASNTPEGLIYNHNSSTTLDQMIYIDSASTKTVLEVITEAKGDLSYYKPLIEEIIRTIKIIR